MVKGNKAKENVTKIIINALGDSFITIADKKIYTWAEDDNGQKVQIAISMTMPKAQVTSTNSTNTDSKHQESTATPTELSSEDKAKVEELMKKLTGKS